jgi:hypothetical protein
MKNVNAEVDKFLKAKKHPLTAEIQKVREIILQSDDKVVEVIKWSSPTFMYKGNIASFYMNAKGFVSLMFHKGAMIKDSGGLLEGEGKESRVARFSDLKDIERKKKALQTLIRNWIKFRDEDK